MKFGVREICDVVLKAKANQKIGNRMFYKNEPVIYFDTLKTSTLEGAATTVYAQGGRGNARLVAWEGERTITFTMEDALISEIGFAILSGAGLTEATSTKPIAVHATSRVEVGAGKSASLTDDTLTITLLDENDKAVAVKASTLADPTVYVMLLDENDEIIHEPFIGVTGTGESTPNVITVKAGDGYTPDFDLFNLNEDGSKKVKTILVDYYVEKAKAQQIDISADKFGGNYYLEASTLFRTQDGVDMPAEFVIPNCKVQSNFTFTMASSGDPSTFTFTMDAFPDYTRWDTTKKVLAAIQIITDDVDGDSGTRTKTNAVEL